MFYLKTVKLVLTHHSVRGPFVVLLGTLKCCYMFHFNKKIAKWIKMCFQPLSVDQSLLFEVDNEALKRLWKCSNDASWQLFWLIFHLSQIFHFIPFWVFKWLNNTFLSVFLCVSCFFKLCMFTQLKQKDDSKRHKNCAVPIFCLIKCFNLTSLIRKASGW